MKLIISPAKKMNVDTDTMEIRGLPRFLDRTRLLCDWLKTMSYDQLKALWRCNDAIASLNYERAPAYGAGGRTHSSSPGL